VVDDVDRPTYSLADVRGYLTGSAPSGFDKNKAELYLSEAEFKGLFGIPKAEWLKYPGWKQAPLRKKFGFF